MATTKTSTKSPKSPRKPSAAKAKAASAKRAKAIAKPRKPVGATIREAKPAKPARPSRPKAAAHEAAEAKPSRPGKPSAPAKPARAPRAPKAEAPGVDVSALMAQIEAQAEQIAKLNATLSKAKAKAGWRSREELLDGAEGILPADDWRNEYHGIEFVAFCHTLNLKTHVLEVEEDGPTFPSLLAIPRDSDAGGKGSWARSLGYIAVHWERNEDGSAYRGTPSYVSQEELGMLVADWPE